jgi:thiamine biosynthesis lipoprotein
MRTGDGGKDNFLFPNYVIRIILSTMNLFSLSGLLRLSSITIIVFINCFNSNPSENLVVLDGSTMGTYYSIKLIKSDLASSKKTSEDIHAEIDSLLTMINRQMSTYINDSEISRFNQYKNSDWFPVSADLRYVIEKSIQISVLSGGAFDITVGPLVNLWGFGTEERIQEIPTDEEIQERMAFIGYRNLSVKPSPSSIKKRETNLYCDLSAIAKGFGVDKITEYLRLLTIHNYLVDIGGEIRARGRNQQGLLWKIGISTPDDKFGIQKAVLIENMAVATSGDYRNYFEIDGQRYSHTIDPTTGKPITHKLASVTVLHDTCMIADALATAIDVMGPDKGYEFAIAQELPVFMIVRENDRFVEKMTPGFEKYLSQD